MFLKNDLHLVIEQKVNMNIFHKNKQYIVPFSNIFFSTVINYYT